MSRNRVRDYLDDNYFSSNLLSQMLDQENPEMAAMRRNLSSGGHPSRVAPKIDVSMVKKILSDAPVQREPLPSGAVGPDGPQLSLEQLGLDAQGTTPAEDKILNTLRKNYQDALMAPGPDDKYPSAGSEIFSRMLLGGYSPRGAYEDRRQSQYNDVSRHGNRLSQYLGLQPTERKPEYVDHDRGVAGFLTSSGMVERPIAGATPKEVETPPDEGGKVWRKRIGDSVERPVWKQGGVEKATTDEKSPFAGSVVERLEQKEHYEPPESLAVHSRISKAPGPGIAGEQEFLLLGSKTGKQAGVIPGGKVAPQPVDKSEAKGDRQDAVNDDKELRDQENKLRDSIASLAGKWSEHRIEKIIGETTIVPKLIAGKPMPMEPAFYSDQALLNSMNTRLREIREQRKELRARTGRSEPPGTSGASDKPSGNSVYRIKGSSITKEGGN